MRTSRLLFSTAQRLQVIPRGIRTYSMSAAETDTQAAQVANSSGITPASLKTTLTEKLDAQFVDVEDISGKPNPVSLISLQLTEDACPRWLWTVLPSHDSISPLCQKDQPCTTPPCQLSAEGRDCGNTCLDAQMLYAGGMGKEEGAGLSGHVLGLLIGERHRTGRR